MIKVLQDAIAEVSRLPDAAQEKIGRELLSYAERLRSLHADIEQGVRSLDAGRGRELDIEDVIARARSQHGKT